jgi:hypothetical protein
LLDPIRNNDMQWIIPNPRRQFERKAMFHKIYSCLFPSQSNFTTSFHMLYVRTYLY